MSQENVEIVRRFVEATQALMDKARQSGGVGASAIDLPEATSLAEQYWHPEAVYETSTRLEGSEYRGPEGAIQATRDWLAVWDDFQAELKEILPAGDRVVVVQDLIGTAKDGMKVELRDFSVVITVRGGQFVHRQDFFSREEALEAAGLSD